ncbi:hypothetical protein [Photobacterium carnosum]|uniref:hypothetical protein n=1 Tax=Photobacterium carnosum TaxID=2023717 RepID=UPI001E3754CD|nr:hypothetical protein [Photobacterium carnosum]MCD9528344.1 hypothetical protein [Photobacterium carnosum]
MIEDVVLLPCEDGYDFHCQKILEAYTYSPYFYYLTTDQKNDVIDMASEITDHSESHIIELNIPIVQACEIFKLESECTEQECNQLKNEYGDSFYTLELEFKAATCGACGSDQTYDKDWNNITSL